MHAIERQSTITCPRCQHRQPLTMPLNACVIHYQCPNCGAVLRGNGDIGCVFTAYGSVPCPFMQDADAMVAWFALMDTRLRQREQLHARNPDRVMRDIAVTRQAEDEALETMGEDDARPDRPCA